MRSKLCIYLCSLMIWASLIAVSAVNAQIVAKPATKSSDDALPGWHEWTSAPQNAPNVIVILVDDAGFGVTSTFGGQVQTPNFSKLAAGGLRYNSFAVNPICSPTRGSLLTGRNSHQLGFGTVTGGATPYPGYNSVWPKSADSIAEVLKENGYFTAAFGKWHNTPQWESGPTGPFDHWPTSLGFQHFYGFMDGWDNQYHPALYENTVPVEPIDTPSHPYNFTHDMTDKAIAWMHQIDAVDPSRPFFLYFATGATHWPLQVPKEWIAKYKGKFDEGWDVLREKTFEQQKALGVIPANAELTPRPEGLPAWDSLKRDQKKLLAREAEVYAGYGEQADYEIGRLLDAVNEEGKSENTLVIEIYGDNGGSAEGGLLGTDALNIKGTRRPVADRLEVKDEIGSESFIDFYAAAWAWEQDTPFQGTKVDASHLGGTRDALVISWPARIHDHGGLRSQFGHVTDIAPTVYQAAGITPPTSVDGVKQLPLEGKSMIYTFDHPDERSHHHIQYFEADGNQGIYKDGWWAGLLYRAPWMPANKSGKDAAASRKWELYNLTDDYSQAHNLADKYPEKLKEMIALFDEEAKRNHVYPIRPKRGEKPNPSNGRKYFVYEPGAERLPEYVLPEMAGRDFTLTADVETSAGAASGVIVARGGRYGGFTLYARDGQIVFEVNAFGNPGGKLVSSGKLSEGKNHIVIDVAPDEGKTGASNKPGTVSMTLNGVDQGKAHFANLVGSQHGESLDVGKDLGTPVSPDYQVPALFTGTVDKVTFSLP